MNRFCALLPCILLLCGLECVEQSCMFEHDDWLINGNNGQMKEFYQCRFVQAQLLNEDERLTTETSSNTKKNSDVDAVVYFDSRTKYIPNSLFTVFPNLEYIVVTSCHLEKIRPHYFKNAMMLKTIWISKNNIKDLIAHSFVEAPYIEYINLPDNKIESIHKMSFSGLHHLKGIYLQNNRISNLHPETFSHLGSLETLHMLDGTNCLKRKFTKVNMDLLEIENQIRGSCIYV